MASIAPSAHTRRDTSSDDWITPQWLIKKLPAFDLDVCASRTQPWACADRQWTESDNGLLMPWSGYVWCNPPYGLETRTWLNRMALYDNGIALVFARTETQMFFDSVWKRARVLLFLKGRLAFARPDGSFPKLGHNSGGPSVLIGYGVRAARDLLDRKELGALVIPGGST